MGEKTGRFLPHRFQDNGLLIRNSPTPVVVAFDAKWDDEADGGLIGLTGSEHGGDSVVPVGFGEPEIRIVSNLKDNPNGQPS